MKRLATTLFCIVVALVACAGTIPPHRSGPLPEKALRITTIPTQYADWWKAVEDCSGHTKPLSSVTWYLVATTSYRGFLWRNPYKGTTEWVAGLAYSDRSVIVMGSGWLFSGPEVRHEMLHLIGSPLGHSPELYQDKCKDVVSCVGQCLDGP